MTVRRASVISRCRDVASAMWRVTVGLTIFDDRNFQRDPKSRWLREVVASLFTPIGESR